jgi:hypothetical protein
VHDGPDLCADLSVGAVFAAVGGSIGRILAWIRLARESLQRGLTVLVSTQTYVDSVII